MSYVGSTASRNMFILPPGSEDGVHEYASMYLGCWELEIGTSYGNPSDFIMF